MKYQITYWTLGDSKVTKIVEADSAREAVEKLVDDPQEPLGHEIEIKLVE